MFARRISAGVLLLCLLLVGLAWWHTRSGAVATYSGLSDASAAFSLDDTTFVAVDDERNTLHVYSTSKPGAPLKSLPWDAELGVAPKDEHPEADIEGAAMLGDTVYWISSHGRNKDGKWRENRHRFFATSASLEGGQVAMRPIGKPYARLAFDLAADPRLKELGLPQSLAPDRKDEETLAPKDAGLNIEGLSASADGKSLLIGFRNPRPGGMALVVPFLNPDDVILKGEAPLFGEPARLRLSREVAGKMVALGIRGMEYSRHHETFLIVAGAHDEQRIFALYRWSGQPADAPQLLPQATAAVAKVESFVPEAIILYPGREDVQLLSDDGSRLVRVASRKECKKGAYHDGLCEAKSLLDDTKKTFRSLWVGVE